MSMWDDEAGYDRSDPKHPDWADMQLSAADDARKARVERRFTLEEIRAYYVEQKKAIAADPFLKTRRQRREES